MPRSPRVMLLDARERGLGENALRDWARSIRPARRAPYVSRSYRHPFALLAWYGGPVGVDIERLDRVGAEFGASIATPAERAALGERLHDDALATSLWCSKEALAKAFGPGRDHEPRRLESPLIWSGGRSGVWRAAALQAPEGHVAWMCWSDQAVSPS